MTRPRLDDALAGLPRLPLGIWPTPLVRMTRLGQALGLDLWMKRDDCSGLALGGNKARKLEFVLGDALADGARTVVTAGPVTSNHTMMTAAAGRRLGVDVHVVLAGPEPPEATGNLALTRYFGAHVHFTPLDVAHPTPDALAASRTLCEAIVRETGGVWIPPGASMPTSVPGYAAAVAEIAAQAGDGWTFDDVIVAYGTGSTAAGLVAGLALADLDCRVHAIAVSSRMALERFAAPSPVALALEAAERYGWGLDAAALERHLHWMRPVDEPGYAIASPASRAALARVARDEGYLLDPTYTAKAAAALIAMASDGTLRRGARVLFMHTGGLSTTAATPTPDSRRPSSPEDATTP